MEPDVLQGKAHARGYSMVLLIRGYIAMEEMQCFIQHNIKTAYHKNHGSIYLYQRTISSKRGIQ